MKLLAFFCVSWMGFAIAAEEVSLASCESYLLGGGAAAHAEGARHWLRQAGPLQVFIDKEVRPDTDLDLIEMFDQEQMNNDNPVEIADAAEEMKHDFIAAIRGMGPTLITDENQPPSFIRAFSSQEELFGETSLTAVDKIALGILETGKDLQVKDLEKVTMKADKSKLRFHNPLLNLEIPLEPAHIGFYFRFPSYNTGPNKVKSTREFLFEHGIVLFERKVGDLRIGYGIPLNTVKWGLPMDQLEVRIYLIRDCEMPVNTPKQPIFPVAGRDSGSLNICMTDTGLSLNYVNAPR